MVEQIARYNKLVQEYQALDKAVDTLLTGHHGHTENMSAEAMQRYRDLARKRDDAFNAVRTMEQRSTLCEARRN